MGNTSKIDKSFWAASAAKGFGRSLGSNIESSVMPEFSKSIMGIKSASLDKEGSFYDVFKSLKESAKFIRRSVWDDVIVKAVGNTVEDLKSGNIYNTKRADADMMGAMGMDFDMGDFDAGSGMDDDFGDMSAPSNASKISSAMKMGRITGAEAAEDAVASKMVDIKAKKLDLGINMMIGQNIVSGLNTVYKSTSSIAEFQRTTTTKFYNDTYAFYDRNITMLSAIGSTLQDMKDLDLKRAAMYNMYEKPRNTGAGGIGKSDMSLAGKIDKWTKDMLGEGSMFQMASGMAKNPLMAGMDVVTSKMIPSSIKKAMQNLDNRFMMSQTLLTKSLSNMSNSDGKLAKLIGNMFKKMLPGAKASENQKDVLGSYVKGAVPFDGITRKAITNVIPTYLRKILNTNEQLFKVVKALGGKKTSKYTLGSGSELLFDYSTGEFKKIKQILDKNKKIEQKKAGEDILDIKKIEELYSGHKEVKFEKLKKDYDRKLKEIQADNQVDKAQRRKEADNKYAMDVKVMEKSASKNIQELGARWISRNVDIGSYKQGDPVDRKKLAVEMEFLLEYGDLGKDLYTSIVRGQDIRFENGKFIKGGKATDISKIFVDDIKLRKRLSKEDPNKKRTQAELDTHSQVFANQRSKTDIANMLSSISKNKRLHTIIKKLNPNIKTDEELANTILNTPELKQMVDGYSLVREISESDVADELMGVFTSKSKVSGDISKQQGILAQDIAKGNMMVFANYSKNQDSIVGAINRFSDLIDSIAMGAGGVAESALTLGGKFSKGGFVKAPKFAKGGKVGSKIFSKLPRFVSSFFGNGEMEITVPQGKDTGIATGMQEGEAVLSKENMSRLGNRAVNMIMNTPGAIKEMVSGGSLKGGIQGKTDAKYDDLMSKYDGKFGKIASDWKMARTETLVNSGRIRLSELKKNKSYFTKVFSEAQYDNLVIKAETAKVMFDKDPSKAKKSIIESITKMKGFDLDKFSGKAKDYVKLKTGVMSGFISKANILEKKNTIIELHGEAMYNSLIGIADSLEGKMTVKSMAKSLANKALGIAKFVGAPVFGLGKKVVSGAKNKIQKILIAQGVRHNLIRKDKVEDPDYIAQISEKYGNIFALKLQKLAGKAKSKRDTKNLKKALNKEYKNSEMYKKHALSPMGFFKGIAEGFRTKRLIKSGKLTSDMLNTPDVEATIKASLGGGVSANIKFLEYKLLATEVQTKTAWKNMTKAMKAGDTRKYEDRWAGRMKIKLRKMTSDRFGVALIKRRVKIGALTKEAIVDPQMREMLIGKYGYDGFMEIFRYADNLKGTTTSLGTMFKVVAKNAMFAAREIVKTATSRALSYGLRAIGFTSAAIKTKAMMFVKMGFTSAAKIEEYNENAAPKDKIYGSKADAPNATFRTEADWNEFKQSLEAAAKKKAAKDSSGGGFFGSIKRFIAADNTAMNKRSDAAKKQYGDMFGSDGGSVESVTASATTRTASATERLVGMFEQFMTNNANEKRSSNMKAASDADIAKNLKNKSGFEKASGAGTKGVAAVAASKKGATNKSSKDGGADWLGLASTSMSIFGGGGVMVWAGNKLKPVKFVLDFIKTWGAKAIKGITRLFGGAIKVVSTGILKGVGKVTGKMVAKAIPFVGTAIFAYEVWDIWKAADQIVMNMTTAKAVAKEPGSMKDSAMIAMYGTELSDVIRKLWNDPAGYDQFVVEADKVIAEATSAKWAKTAKAAGITIAISLGVKGLAWAAGYAGFGGSAAAMLTAAASTALLWVGAAAVSFGVAYYLTTKLLEATGGDKLLKSGGSALFDMTHTTRDSSMDSNVFNSNAGRISALKKSVNKNSSDADISKTASKIQNVGFSNYMSTTSEYRELLNNSRFTKNTKTIFTDATTMFLAKFGRIKSDFEKTGKPATMSRIVKFLTVTYLDSIGVFAETFTPGDELEMKMKNTAFNDKDTSYNLQILFAKLYMEARDKYDTFHSEENKLRLEIKLHKQISKSSPKTKELRSKLDSIENSKPVFGKNMTGVGGKTSYKMSNMFGMASLFADIGVERDDTSGVSASGKYKLGSNEDVMDFPDARRRKSYAGLDPEIRKPFTGMAKEYYELTGDKMHINSGYRSITEQAALKERLGNKAATPGRSLHNIGYAVDANSKDLIKADDMGLLKKYGLTRPLASRNKKGGLIEEWHTELSKYQKSVNKGNLRKKYFKSNEDERQVYNKYNKTQITKDNGVGDYGELELVRKGTGMSGGQTGSLGDVVKILKVIATTMLNNAKANASGMDMKDILMRINETMISLGILPTVQKAADNADGPNLAAYNTLELLTGSNSDFYNILNSIQ